MRELNESIVKEETGMNRELFKRCFNFQMPTAMLKAVYSFGSSDLKNEIEEMSEDEIKIKKPYEIANIVENIL